MCACATPHSGVAKTARKTPLFHIRPTLRSLSPAQKEALRSSFDAIFPNGGLQSLCVIDGRGDQVYERNADRAVVPASAQKLIVASTALNDLGATYRYVTTLASASHLQDGTLGGDLWLIGSGDPILVSNDLRGGVNVLARSGLGTVRGGVRVDAASLQGPERNALWDASDAQYGFSAATSGISLDQDTIEVHVTPSLAGQPAHVRLEPPTNLVNVTGTVITVASDSPRGISVQPRRANDFTIAGNIGSRDRTAVLYFPVRDVPRYVADVLTRMLLQRNIHVMRAPSTGSAPHAIDVLWEHRSPPLLAIVSKMLFESNNHLAEQLLRTIGRVTGGAGTDEAGVAAERHFLYAQHVPEQGLHLVDGSGLSASNRVSALTLAALLEGDLRLRAGRLYGALPRVGVAGTVRYYDIGAARGRVRAKSGHLAGAQALAGYVVSRHAGTFSFAFLFDGAEDQADIDKRIVHAVERLAEF